MKCDLCDVKIWEVCVCLEFSWKCAFCPTAALENEGPELWGISMNCEMRDVNSWWVNSRVEMELRISGEFGENWRFVRHP